MLQRKHGEHTRECALPPFARNNACKRAIARARVTRSSFTSIFKCIDLLCTKHEEDDDDDDDDDTRH